MDMINLTSKSVLLLRLSLFSLSLFFSSLAVANNGTQWYAQYKAKVALSNRSTGSGTVYMVADESDGSTTILTLPDDNGKETSVRSAEKTVKTSSPETYKHTFNNIKLVASALPGSKFEGWEEANLSGASPIIVSYVSYNLDDYKSHTDKAPYPLPIDVVTYHPIFTARTYEAKSQSIGIITLDEEGNVSTDVVGGSVSLDGTNWSSEPIAGGDDVTQSADDNGKKAQATFLPRFYAQANEGYTFVGWAKTPEESKTEYEKRRSNPLQGEVVSTAELGEDKVTPPSLGTYYAVFIPTIYYYHTGAVVGIAGNQNEWDAKGRVYVDSKEALNAGGINTITGAQWKTYMQDETVHEEKEKFFKYTYYAKVLNPDKVAFKGWTTSPNGEPSYTDNPLVDYEHKMTDENTSREKPFRTPTLYAVFESYYYKTPAVAVANNSKGAGFVNVSLTEGLSLDLCTKEEVNASEETYQVPANGTSYSYKVAYYAKNKPGTRFEYWSSTADGSTIVSRDATYVEDYESTATDANYPHVAPALYAVFSSDIDIRQQDRMIVYVDEEGNANINDSKVLIDFQKGNTLTATLLDATDFTLSNRSGSKSGSSVTFDATQGLIELVVAYKGDLNDAVGKTANITLSAISGGEEISRPITIKVEEAPIITFLPTDGKGEYVVSMTNGSGVNYTMEKASKENIVVPVTHESMSNIEIALREDDASDDYYFFGWQMIDGDDVTYLSYEQLFTYQFTKPVTVRADFVHKDIATYRILNDPSNTPYHDFALVMSDAKKLYAINGTQTVMLNETVNGVQVTKAFLPKGNYTIPKGVQFIVPGKTVKGYREALEQTDFTTTASGYNEYIRWIVEEGTIITVEGGASVSVLANAITKGSSSPNGLPYDYGHIELNENCKMEFLGDSKLFVYGYVTGPESSSIVMKDQSKVKELLQIYDWRGGSATILGLSSLKSNKIFPLSQYFVQNIEVPLTITAEATEELDAALQPGGDPVNMSLTFVSQNAGFVQLSSGYSMTKYYDKHSDRIRMTVEKEEGATGTAELGSIGLNVTGVGYIGSEEFVLPLPHNYDVVLGKNTETNVLHDMALLPGATVHVKEGAVVNLGVSNTANFFIYDQKYSKVDGKGYFGSSDAEFFAISARPNGLQYKRTSKTIQDAQLIVDGTLNTPKGYLYTTNSKTETTDHARITSNGGGKVQFNALGTKTDTKQATHQKYGIDVVSIPVAPARLLHGSNGTYQEPSANTTYTYINGRWMANSDETEKPVEPTTVSVVPVFTVTNYATSSYVGKLSEGTTTVATNNAEVDWTKVTWTYQLYGEHADQFVFAWTTKPNGKITFKPESEGVKKATLRITATYSCADVYEVTAKYTYSKDIYLTGNATYLEANTLAFADLSSLYVGQQAIALFAEEANNRQPITISVEPKGQDVVTVNGNTATATITPNKVGEVTITATQAADLTNNIAGTIITKTIKVTEPVIWNWDILYFGTVNTDPVTVLDGATGWTLAEKEDKKNIINYDASRKTATIEDQIAGKYEVIFEFKKGNLTKEFKSVVIVNPQHLRVDVNNDTIYRAVTLSANDQVGFDNENKAVKFQSSVQNISQWKMTFIGVPDKIYFTPQGVNSWQIEESTNGVNWTTSMPWKYLTSNVPFEMSLLPSTRYVRISYGAGSTDVALLKELYITELADVKADVNKIYMPIDGVNNAVKEVVLTYANTGELSVTTNQPKIFKVKLLDSANDYDERFLIPATTDKNPFGIKGVEVVCLATEPTTAELQVWNGSQLALQIPIYAYEFPQELPIKLATDEPAGGDRYYYVTTHSHNAEWNGEDGVRTITMNNAVSDAAPYVTFAFDGAPTFISFDYTATAKGVWEIEESADGKNYTTTTPAGGDVMADGKLHRTVSTSSKYLRVIYQSPYAEKIDITDLTIVGGESVVVNPTNLQLDYDEELPLTMTAINLTEVYIIPSSSNFKVKRDGGDYSDEGLYISGLAGNGIVDIPLYVKWTGEDLPMVEYGNLFIGLRDPEGGDNHKVLATVELVGIRNTLAFGVTTKTGVPDGKDDKGNESEDEIKYTLKGSFDGSSHRDVNISAAFSASDDKPLFDYVVIYGETTTNDGQKTITTPNKNAGSNAKTPYYIYKKNDGGTEYELYQLVENANSSNKAWKQDGDDAVTIAEGKESVSMYITGFCPYATTGYTKAEEGVWYFRANGGQKIDVYLEDCYIYSRAKTKDGHTFVDRADGNSFVDGYVCGSGAVLVFACNDKSNATSMNVTIHTLGTNILKSNYGCFFQSPVGRAFQASSPVQIRLIDDTYWQGTKTTLNFTDEWPASQNSKTGEGVRTNGFISLQKQVNNAPSIDMGAPNTVVNFNGGQVELQNAQIVSHNYKSSLAICPRSGEFAGIRLSYGMATDATLGTVNFNDGTTTVQPMWVSPDYFESYLCDKDENGNYIKNSKGEYRTTCLRTPANTFVYGGSHCMMRACTDPESQGGAPKDANGKLLGLYKYPNVDNGKKWGWDVIENGNGLVTPRMVPKDEKGTVTYGISSVTPNNNGTTDDADDDYLNFWFDPDFESSVQPEINKQISYWKTCMTRIEAEYAGEGGAVGGDTEVSFENGEQTEIVKNLLYCQLDVETHNVIISGDYAAPVKNPAPAGGGLEAYLPIKPSFVGEEYQHYITNGETYKVENKVYYITTATADVWMTFTAPFNVEKIYIVETYPEAELEKIEAFGEKTQRDNVLLEQAKHNADFASFFAVTIALGQNKSFETIYGEWLDWAKMRDKEAGFYKSGKYTLRGKTALIPYNGSNWDEAHFYLNENNGPWGYQSDGKGGYEFTPNWITPELPSTNKPLFEQGKTYSLLFPYCVGCDTKSRGYWDYWSGKILIFESTDGSVKGAHTIYGADYVTPDGDIFEGWVEAENNAVLLGNPTFAQMESTDARIYPYFAGDPGRNNDSFEPGEFFDENDEPIAITIEPTNSFLLSGVTAPEGQEIESISYTGKIKYRETTEEPGEDLGTGDEHVPTIGDSSDIFVTSTFEGINIAVAEPQYVGVFAANGTLLFNGWVEKSVNVALMNKGVYVVVGENVSVKVIY